ncbi:MAG: transporter [Phenylobacterium sp.]
MTLPRHSLLIGLLAACALAGGTTAARAQSIEPRAYSAAPTGFNFVIAGAAQTTGGLSFDTAVPITDPELKVRSAVFAYARTLDLWGRSGKLDVIVPVNSLRGHAIYRGEPAERNVDGLGDPLARLSVILYGARAMTPAQFRTFRQDTLVGASLQVSAPLGQYDGARLINLGSHRWSFKPEVGVSKAAGPWVVELKGAVTLFTDNNDFFGGGSRTQKPLYSAQANAIYNFKPGLWASLDGTYFTGGRSTVNGSLNNDLQRNWRVGATLAVPVTSQQSIKFYASRGVSARTGNNFDLIGVAWQYRWFSRP